MGIAEFTIPPHAPTPPLHVHHAHEEVFNILEGELEFMVGTEKLRASQGDFIMVPIGAIHTFDNLTNKPARFLNTFTPPLYIDYFEELSKLMQESTPADPRQMVELMARYQTEVIVL
ncbi:cupin domain-containing protein [Dictyobacter arantiisoli]|uniref:cupin domain-containing protein n=1 Tax=Dictyobacter arantiisoli TaxID=2014874 RepID=UPI00155A8107|nr:cupin domain-containing protein [Dictyobacter arantiisoli]